MKHLRWPSLTTRTTGLALTLLALPPLALLGTSTPGVAGGTTTAPPASAQDLVPFKATITGLVEGFVVPVVPPIVTAKVTGTGQGTLLGQTIDVKVLSGGLGQLGIDGKPLTIKEAHVVFTTASGDQVFATYSGVFLPQLTSLRYRFEAAFTVTGGTGRFAGATGSGTLTGDSSLLGEATIVGEGMISRPKA